MLSNLEIIGMASSNLVVRGIFLNPIISKLDKHVVLLPINYRVSKNSLFKAKLNVQAKTIQFILNWTVFKN